MANQASPDEFQSLYEVLMPALSRASVGDFGAEIEVDRDNSVQVNELLVGVSVLFEVIRDQRRELADTKAKFERSADGSHMPLLDEVLGRQEKR